MIYAFGEFELDTALYELRSSTRPLPVEPQVFNVLLYLVEHRDTVVTKEQLLDDVWGDRFVSESALTSRIKTARRLLGDDGKSQRFIRTSHGRGYRFVAPIRELEAGPQASSGVEAEVAATEEESFVPVLERDAVVRPVRRLIDSAVAGGVGAVVVVSGEAGMGKTTVVAEIRRLCSANAQFLVGACDDLATPRAMGPIQDMASEVGGGLRAVLDGGGRDAVAVELLTMLRQPSVVVIEDLHWADDATLDLVRLVGRKIMALPSVLIVTCRSEPGELPPAVRATLGALSGGHVRRIELEPLSRDGVALLVGDGQDPDVVHALTRGNPFFVSELRRTRGDGAVPLTVRDSVLGRLVRLPAAAQAVVARLSVVPGRAERWLVRGLTADPADALDAAQRLGLLAGDASYVWFRHELVRRTIESTLTTEERLRASAIVLQLLLERAEEVEPSRIVHHAAVAHEADAVIAHGPRAAHDAARLGSHRQAVAHQRAVLEYRKRLPAPTVAECLTGLAYSLYLLNEFTAASTAAADAVAEAERSGDEQLLGAALSALTRATLWATGPSAARTAASRQVALLEHSGDDGRLGEALCDLARTCSNLSTVGPVADPAQEALEVAERALDLAERIGRTDIASQALTYRGTSRLAIGDLGGLADLERAGELAVGHRPELFVRSTVNAAGACARLGRISDAERYIETGLAVSAENEIVAVEARLTLTSASMAMTTGAWDRATELLERIATRNDDPGIMRPLALSLLARIQARRTKTSAARQTLEPALAAAAASDEAQLVMPIAVAAVEVAWLAGESAPEQLARRALALPVAAGGAAARAELCRYLQRAGVDVEIPADPPEPWATSLRCDHRAAAAAWQERGERYERALELAASGDPADLDSAIDALTVLAAFATADRIADTRRSVRG